MKAFVLEKNVYPHLCMECIQNDVKIHTKPSALEAGRQKEKVGIKGNFHILPCSLLDYWFIGLSYRENLLMSYLGDLNVNTKVG